MIRAALVRALVLSAAFAGSLMSVRCLADNQLPAKATKELSPQLLSLLQEKNMPKHSRILVRIFKEESELEVWKQDTTGHFQILKIYPICRWSGDLGPKVHAGDRQAPEGFYTITPELMNPNSNYYLAINTGFPNTFDKANDRCDVIRVQSPNRKGPALILDIPLAPNAVDDSLAFFHGARRQYEVADDVVVLGELVRERPANAACSDLKNRHPKAFLKLSTPLRRLP